MASLTQTQKFDYDTVNEIFKKFGIDIRKRITTKEFISAMRKKLSDADLQPIECQCNKEGSIRAADDLMDAVKRKPNSFVQFVYTLCKEGHDDIVDGIRDYLWKRHTTLLTHLDEKLQKKGLQIKSKNVMVVGPLGQQAPSDKPPNPVLPPVMGHPLQSHSGQCQPHLRQVPLTSGTVNQQPILPHTFQSREIPELPTVIQPSLNNLPGTTNNHSSADIVLTDMPYNLFIQLSEKLQESEPSDWQKLAREFSFLTRKDVKDIGKEKNPGEALLDKLGEKGYTVHQLAMVLKNACLQNEVDILQAHYGEIPELPSIIHHSSAEGQLDLASSSNIQQPVNSPQQQELHAVSNQSKSASATSPSSSEESRNPACKQHLELIDENNLNKTIEKSLKMEAVNKTLNIAEPQKEPSADGRLTQSLSNVSLDTNADGMQMGDNQDSQSGVIQQMLNTTCDRQSNESMTDNNPNEAEGDPQGKSAIHNADIDRLHLQQEMIYQLDQQDLLNPSLNDSFKDIHNAPGHVTMQMDSQLRNDAETF